MAGEVGEVGVGGAQGTTGNLSSWLFKFKEGNGDEDDECIVLIELPERMNEWERLTD